MRIELDVSKAELGRGVQVLLGELKKLGLEIRIDQALRIISVVLAAFTKGGKDEGDEGGHDK